MSRRIACHLSSQNTKNCGEQLQQSPFSGIADKKYTIPDSGYSNHDLC